MILDTHVLVVRLQAELRSPLRLIEMSVGNNHRAKGPGSRGKPTGTIPISVARLVDGQQHAFAIVAFVGDTPLGRQQHDGCVPFAKPGPFGLPWLLGKLAGEPREAGVITAITQVLHQHIQPPLSAKDQVGPDGAATKAPRCRLRCVVVNGPGVSHHAVGNLVGRHHYGFQERVQLLVQGRNPAARQEGGIPQLHSRHASTPYHQSAFFLRDERRAFPGMGYGEMLIELALRHQRRGLPSTTCRLPQLTGQLAPRCR